MDYENLRNLYPDEITKDQFYRIAHISKYKATWILENGLLPCVDSGKKTRRFKIKLVDVIVFLQRRDMGEFELLIPKNIFSSKKKTNVHVGKIANKNVNNKKLCKHLLLKWKDLPDMLSLSEVKVICGYRNSTLIRWIEKERVQAVRYRSAHWVFKESLAEFLCSDTGQEIVNKSSLHRELIDEFAKR